MSDPTAALVLAGVDAERIEVQERPMLGPHLFVDCGEYALSIIGELDVAALVRREWQRKPDEPLPLRTDVIEIALLAPGRDDVLAEPLRNVPFAVAAEICRRAIAGDVSAFDRGDS